MSPIWNCSNGTDQYELRLRRAIRARSDAQSAYLRCLGELQVWARATVLESQGCWLGVISGKARPEHLLSAFPPKADFARSLRDVRFVPKADIAAALPKCPLSRKADIY